MIAVEKESLLLTDPKKRGHATSRGATGGELGLVRRQSQRSRNVGKSLYCGFSGREQARQGQQA